MPRVCIFPLRVGIQDFLKAASAHSATGNFSFNIGKYEVVGLTGARSRKFFFDTGRLHLSEGYMILFNAAPPVRSNDEDPHMPRGFPAYFTRTLVTLLKPDVLRRYMPKYVSDIQYQLDQMAFTSRLTPHHHLLFTKHPHQHGFGHNLHLTPHQ